MTTSALPIGSLRPFVAAIEKLCSPFSAECAVEVPWLDKKKKKVQKHKGFAFVSFPDATVAAAAIDGAPTTP
eukprot:9467837-Pyramimonas_sp.AAC.2